MYNPFNLKGKTIFVTGASSGIGRSIALECSKAGASLIITGRNAERLSQTFSDLSGSDHQMFVADLTHDSDLKNLVDFVPPLDGVVHVAGKVTPKPFQFLNQSELDNIMNINFNAPVLLSNYLIRAKKIKRAGSVVFISSISGVMCSFIGGSGYSASKGALNGVIKGMALDLASKQIRVNSVIPGMIDTGIFAGSGNTPQELEEDKKRYPLGRYGKPEDVAFAVIYLLSDASQWSTGTNILLDGGYTLT
jgi:NAD(P)-dependent dehydrogenase (short-subunit alcohol dehydrogenase family)